MQNKSIHLSIYMCFISLKTPLFSSKPSNLGLNADSMKDIPYDEQLLCYLAVLDTM